MTDPPSSSSTFVVGSSSKWRCGIIKDWLSSHPSNAALKGMKVISVDPDIDEKAIRHPMPDTLCVAIGKAKLDAVITKLRGATSTATPSLPMGVEYVVAGDQLAVYQRPTIALDGTTALPPKPLKYNPDLDCLEAEVQMDGVTTSVPVALAVEKGLVTFDIREKPESVEECKTFLNGYSNAFVQTVASIVVHHVPTGRTVHTVDVNTVHFSEIPDETQMAMIYKDGIEGGPNGDCMSCCGGFVVEDPYLSKCVTSIEGRIEGVQGMNPAKLDELIQQLA